MLKSIYNNDGSDARSTGAIETILWNSRLNRLSLTHVHDVCVMYIFEIYSYIVYSL